MSEYEFEALFEPQEDITAYELAYIVARARVGIGGNLMKIRFQQPQWDKIPERIRRHFSAVVVER
jgi:hypothetical protein